MGVSEGVGVLGKGMRGARGCDGEQEDVCGYRMDIGFGGSLGCLRDGGGGVGWVGDGLG